jgi:predicted permease
VGEVALAVGLLVVGGLSVLDVYRLGRIEPGFATEGITTWRMQLPQARYPDDEARLAFVDRYLERLRAIPGVQNAIVASTLPLSGHWGWFYEVEDAPARQEGESNPVVLTRSVTPGYFDAMGVRLVAGRAFDPFDGRDEASRAVIVNETFVRTHMDDGLDPVGRRIRTGEGSPWLTVVGLAGDVKHYGLDEPVRPGVYQPIRQIPLRGFMVAIRSAPEAASPLPTARAVTAELDPELPLFAERTMASILADSLWARRATSWVIGAFSTVALLLAVAGLYGVISYSVGQRTREIGVRMAMGARARQVRGQVVRQGMAVVALGVALGVGAALASAGVVSSLLSQVEATEWRVYVGVCALLLAVAALANWLPARRAAALDPMTVLRSE